MPDADERAAADAAVEAALEARAVAYGAEPTGITTGWFAVLARTDYDDGDQITKYAVATPTEQPLHIDLGLLTYAQAAVGQWLNAALTAED